MSQSTLAPSAPRLPAPAGYRRGVVWLLAALALTAIVGAELGGAALRTLAEQQTIGAVSTAMQADYAAQAGLTIACAELGRGSSPDARSGRCGSGSYRIEARRTTGGWLVVALGEAEGPAGLVARQRIEAVVGGAGTVKRWRYVRPLAPAPAGRT